MTGNGNNPNVTIATPQMTRLRVSGPILIVAILFVVASFLSWYFTWFGRELSDTDISNYLADDKHPRHVQHALLQIQQRIERKDPTAKRWYPQILALAENLPKHQGERFPRIFIPTPAIAFQWSSAKD